MTEKHAKLFTAIKQSKTIAERERIAAEWLRDIAAEGVVLVDEFPTDCAAYFACAAYCSDNVGTAEVIAYGIRGAYLIGAATSKHRA